MDSGLPIQIGLTRIIANKAFAVVKRLQRGQRISHVGMFILRAITDPSIENIIRLSLLLKIALQTDQKLSRFAKHWLIFRLVGRDQRHHAKRSIISDEVRLKNASIRLHATQNESVSFAHPVRFPLVWLRNRIPL